MLSTLFFACFLILLGTVNIAFICSCAQALLADFSSLFLTSTGRSIVATISLAVTDADVLTENLESKGGTSSWQVAVRLTFCSCKHAILVICNNLLQSAHCPS